MRRLHSLAPIVFFCFSATIILAGSGFYPNAVANARPPEASASDEARLSFSTYLGSNTGRAVAVDSAGNIYITGEVRSASLSANDGAAQPNFGGGESDAFVIKLNASGNQIVYATYIGGSAYDGGADITVDSSGNAYVVGTTGSLDFPTTAGAFQTTGRGSTVFVVKLNPEGSALTYSTYLGNALELASNDGRAIAVDAEGSACVTGLAGPGFPTTPGAFQRASGGFVDAFVAKLNATGSMLLYSTFLGGPEQDIGQDIAVDSAGNAYVVGGAGLNFPTTAGAFKKSLSGTNNDVDGFVTKLNPTGSALVYSTYIGGTNSDAAFGVALDLSDNAYVTGQTNSADFPTTNGAFLRTKLGVFNAFVTKLNAAGSGLVYSTYFGGKGSESGASITVDSEGNAYVTGTTSSVEMPVPRGFQRRNGSGPTFKSTSAGQDWGVINAGLATSFVWSLVVDTSNPSALYAATPDGIFKSADGGASWAALNEGQEAFEAFSLAVDPVNPQTLYAASREGISKSTDGGARWASSLASLFTQTISIDPSNPSNVYAGARDAAGCGVTRSTNAGATWSFVRLAANAPDSTVNTLAIDPSNTSTVYAGTSKTGGVYGTVFRSTDAGRSWTNTLLNVIDVSSIAVAPISHGTVYAATEEGLFRSGDQGAHWIGISNGLPRDPVSVIVDPGNGSTVYAGVQQSSLGGVFKSTNGGDSWAATGLSSTSAWAIAIDPRAPSILYAATSVASDAFVAKFNATGSALFYSTYLGGISDDAFLLGINSTIDTAGNAYVAGTTRSRNFPTVNALKSNFSGQYSESFLAKIEPGGHTSAPIITGVVVSGKRLLVSGENFSDSAAILLSGEDQKTSNDETGPNTKLIGKKAGKKISRGQTVMIQVKNSDRTLSIPFTFTRPVE
jgi:beta-propeller repeat-containing protein